MGPEGGAAPTVRRTRVSAVRVDTWVPSRVSLTPLPRRVTMDVVRVRDFGYVKQSERTGEQGRARTPGPCTASSFALATWFVGTASETQLGFVTQRLGVECCSSRTSGIGLGVLLVAVLSHGFSAVPVST